MYCWAWLIAGLVMMAMEVIGLGGLVLIFFGLGAIITGAIAWSGLLDHLVYQWMLFSVASLASLWILRPQLVEFLWKDKARPDLDSVIGLTATALVSIETGAVGSGEMRGTGWRLQNVGSACLQPGDTCKVVRQNGLTLEVSSESKMS